MKDEILDFYKQDRDDFNIPKRKKKPVTKARKPRKRTYVLPRYNSLLNTLVDLIGNEDFDVVPSGTYCSFVLQGERDRWWNRYFRAFYRKQGILLYVPPMLSYELEKAKWPIAILSMHVQRTHRPMMSSVFLHNKATVGKFVEIFREWAEKRNYMPMAVQLSEYQDYTDVLAEWKDTTEP